MCWLCLSERSHNWRTRCCLSAKWVRGNERDPEGLGEVYSPRPLLSSQSLDSLLMFHLSPQFLYAISSFTYRLLVLLMCIWVVFLPVNVTLVFFLFFVHFLILYNYHKACCLEHCVSSILFLIFSQPDLFKLFIKPCYPHIHPFVHPLLPLDGLAHMYCTAVSWCKPRPWTL